MLTRLTAAAAVLIAAPALADTPPEGAMALSAVIAQVEAYPDFAYIEQIDWEDDDGYWEVEYRTTDGAEVEINLDPMTGASR